MIDCYEVECTYSARISMVQPVDERSAWNTVSIVSAYVPDL